MTKNEITIQHVLITAVIEDDRATLVDRDGRPLRRNVKVTRLAKLTDERMIRERWAWWEAVRRMKACIAGRMFRRSTRRDPWQTKAASLAASFRRRSNDHLRPRGRCRFEQYSTPTWEQAVKRLWQQGNNRFRHISRSEWHRWAYTVSNNHNKKMGGRYAKAQYRHGQANSKTDREAKVSLCPERSEADA